MEEEVVETDEEEEEELEDDEEEDMEEEVVETDEEEEEELEEVEDKVVEVDNVVLDWDEVVAKKIPAPATIIIKMMITATRILEIAPMVLCNFITVFDKRCVNKYFKNISRLFSHRFDESVSNRIRKVNRSWH
jgi:hypothetical protein